ncbi:copper homeostasis periplasmic binding protein CopC [Rhodoblastus acidophilus]|uniref:Copper homeostasis periplasmic binding protein CopC n=1 Tax=Candidatus Rhodoblastus alkanivorans TaxID=2954117 RepID=A0ABS9Z2Y0_9HYPH|nr:copper homeostasis periplasmic binding protein CopC [Candidatus Rhodoblastus alkanivorans]MCI4677294.1 copper homeostasis periplasmic binding protein CopC [Candidatus Rhodoblastus alkanivorans]MCI4682029.1 copper homeostasis periplasmic binding protein CopC [Candidatus Rhodoblastus alkanivorans]MDI4643080.1 copper homeostasis periplasmic binding protein CopC [Rhodoblastus acidophilus]
MNIRAKSFVAALAVAAAFNVSAFNAPAWAHAFLDHAVPAVGSSVQGAPRELTLNFTENIAPAFSGVTLASAAGGAIAKGKARVDPSSPATLHVSIGRKLAPGTYVVRWHVVSVDTHHTSGSYKFTVAP